MTTYESWGRVPQCTQSAVPLTPPHGGIPIPEGESVLPYGLGRSYGDVCLNEGNTVLPTGGLDAFISFDRSTGVIRCEAGVSLHEVLGVAVPAGWFLPVSPGTRFVSVGGAVANDVHGKNHHCAGTFGCHVRAFELVRSDGTRLECSSEKNTALFRATIGGVGLTGLIVWVEFQLLKVEGPYIAMDSIKFCGLKEFFELSEGSDKSHDYTVAWLDCVSGGSQFARGIFMRGNHTRGYSKTTPALPKELPLTVPFSFPGFVLNPYSIRAFNEVYYHKQFQKSVSKRVHYGPFFYPLDAVKHWNRIYGRRGFVQFQCALPTEVSKEVLPEILRYIVKTGKASFLAVLKEFGTIPSPGLMSFPLPGATLCLDFPFQGEKTRAMMRDLEMLTRDAGGRLYPAKDACMSPESFESFYPQWRSFAEHIDPAFSSSFWRRVTEGL